MNKNPKIYQNPRTHKDRKEELIVLWALWQDEPFMHFPLSRERFHADLIALHTSSISRDAVESAWAAVTATVGSLSTGIAREELGLLAIRYAAREWSVEDLKEILQATKRFRSDDWPIEVSKCHVCGREASVSVFSFIQKNIAGELPRDPDYKTLIDEILDKASKGVTPNDAK